MDLDHQQAHPVDARREAMREQALALRISGLSYREIARRVTTQNGTGIGVATAHLLVTEALEAVIDRNTDQAQVALRLELERLDAMIVKLWPKVKDGGVVPPLEVGVANTLIRIGERRAKLLGLDAPTRWEGSGPDGGAIPLSVNPALDLSKLSNAELRMFERLYLKAQPAIPSTATAALASGTVQNGPPPN